MCYVAKKVNWVESSLTTQQTNSVHLQPSEPKPTGEWTNGATAVTAAWSSQLESEVMRRVFTELDSQKCTS